MEQIDLVDVLYRIANAKNLDEYGIAKLQVDVCKLLTDEYTRGLEKGIEMRSTGE